MFCPPPLHEYSGSPTTRQWAQKGCWPIAWRHAQLPLGLWVCGAARCTPCSDQPRSPRQRQRWPVRSKKRGLHRLPTPAAAACGSGSAAPSEATRAAPCCRALFVAGTFGKPAVFGAQCWLWVGGQVLCCVVLCCAVLRVCVSRARACVRACVCVCVCRTRVDRRLPLPSSAGCCRLPSIADR